MQIRSLSISLVVCAISITNSPVYSEEFISECVARFERAYPQGIDFKWFRFPPDNREDPLPPWDYVAIINAAIDSVPDRPVEQVADAQLLAWTGQVDSRPLYINSAIVVLVYKGDPGHQEWGLVHLVQNPIPDCGNSVDQSKWHPAMISDVAWKPVQIFEARPTHDELHQFLSVWKGRLSSDHWRVLTVGIREKSWSRLLYDPPPNLIDLTQR